MRIPKRTTAAVIAFLAACVAAPALHAQDHPLRPSYVAGDRVMFQIELTVHSEVRGEETEQIGAKTYVKPFARGAEAGLRWTATRRVLHVAPDGTAEMQESLGEFEESSPAAAESDASSMKLLAAVRESLNGWKNPRELRYRETRDGQISGLTPEGVPPLGEEQPAVLTLWLLRALRPAVTLPQTPLRIGVHWQQPRSLRLAPWTDLRATESGEWLEGPAGQESAVELQVVQRIQGRVEDAGGRFTGDGKEGGPTASGEANFYADSVARLSLFDAHLISATRSASREVVWTLAAVEGLPERPQFRAKLSVSVTIRSLP